MLGLAIRSMEGSEVMDGHTMSLYSGVVLTEEVLQKVFARHGLVPIKAEGEPFDPNYHDAVFEVSSEQVGPISLVPPSAV